MERKLALLEHRLNLVEQYIEKRFCESYRDFTCRNSTGEGEAAEKDESLELLGRFIGMRFCESFRDFTIRHLLSQTHQQSNEESLSTASDNQNSQITENSQTKTKPLTSSRPTTRSSTAERELRIKVVRLEDTKSKEKKPSAGPVLIKVGSPLRTRLPDNLEEDDFQQDNFEEISGGEDEDGGDRGNGEDYSYFTFPSEEREGDDDDEGARSGNEDDPLDTSAIDPDDEHFSEATSVSSEDSDFEVPKRKASSSKSKSKKKKINSLKKKCPHCHTHWLPHVLEKHVQTHGKERKLKCGYPPCTKAFFDKKHLTEHERIHQKDKWLACRVEGCGKLCLDNSKRLRHERICILKSLKKGNHVNPEVIEDVRRRSGKLRENPLKGIKEMVKVENEEGVDGGGDGSTRKKMRKKEPSYACKPDMLGDIVNGEMRSCEICKKHFKADAYEGHLRSHVMERTLKCQFCEKRFFSRKTRYKHEREHEKEKYALRCRVGGEGDGGGEWCEAIFGDKTKLLFHERGCVRRALEKGREVGKEVIEDVRRRSKGKMLNWKGYDLGEEEVGRVKVCFVCKRWKGEGKEYEEHMEGHRNWGCGKCGGRFLSKRDLVRHVHRKHREKGEGEGEEMGDEVNEEREEETTGEPEKEGEVVRETADQEGVPDNDTNLENN